MLTFGEDYFYTPLVDFMKINKGGSPYETVTEAIIAAENYYTYKKTPSPTMIQSVKTLGILHSITDDKGYTGSDVKDIIRNAMSIFLGKYLFATSQRLSDKTVTAFENDFIHGENAI